MSLDTKTNREKREAEKAKKAAEEIPPLNPPWPYIREYFDPFFFNLQAEPKKPEPSPFPEPL